MTLMQLTIKCCFSFSALGTVFPSPCTEEVSCCQIPTLLQFWVNSAVLFPAATRKHLESAKALIPPPTSFFCSNGDPRAARTGGTWRDSPPKEQDIISHFSKLPRTTYVYVQVKKPSSGSRDYDSCLSGAEEEVRWCWLRATNSTEGGEVGADGWDFWLQHLRPLFVLSCRTDNFWFLLTMTAAVSWP